MLFYKYKCKKCGKRYVELPKTCENCGTKLKFLCPCASVYLPIEKLSEDCEQIFEPRFSFFRKSLQKEYESKIKGLNNLLSGKQEEINQLLGEKVELKNTVARKDIENMLLKKDNEILSMKLSSLETSIEHYQKIAETKGNFSPTKDVKDAVFYAMKKSHPDNGGKEEDFIRFKKCYEELTRK